MSGLRDAIDRAVSDPRHDCGQLLQAAWDRISELEVALRRGIACIESMRPMVMWDGIEGDQDDGEVSVTLMLMNDALKED